MKKNDVTPHEIAEAARHSDALEILQPPMVGLEAWENELLLFIKPEVFMVTDQEKVERTINLVLNKLRDFDVQVNGIVIVGGRLLDQTEIMNRHYGFINLLSRSASRILDSSDKRLIEEALNVVPRSYRILGGHEYLGEFPEESTSDLDNVWFSSRSVKIRSGFYVRYLQKGASTYVLVNGFHPAQLAHFTNPDHRIALFLIHSDTSWSILRNDMVGTTYPEKALPGSIRGTLYGHPREYGFDSVTIANNGVHLSAGPFEAQFEIVNFLGKLLELNVDEEPPLVLRRLIQAGIESAIAKRALTNPQINYSGKTVDLFTATEDMKTSEAIDIYKASIT